MKYCSHKKKDGQKKEKLKKLGHFVASLAVREWNEYDMVNIHNHLRKNKKRHKSFANFLAVPYRQWLDPTVVDIS